MKHFFYFSKSSFFAISLLTSLSASQAIVKRGPIETPRILSSEEFQFEKSTEALDQSVVSGSLDLESTLPSEKQLDPKSCCATCADLSCEICLDCSRCVQYGAKGIFSLLKCIKSCLGWFSCISSYALCCSCLIIFIVVIIVAIVVIRVVDKKSGNLSFSSGSSLQDVFFDLLGLHF